MPGLFDNYPPQPQQSGILRGLGGALSPEIYRQNALEDAFRQNGFDPTTARALAIDPAASQGFANRQIMEQTYSRLLQGGMDKNQAAILALHPEILSEQGKPMNLDAGNYPFTPLFGMLGGAPNASQQQQPSSQPGPSNASVGGSPPASGGMPFQNTNGIIDPQTARRAAEQWVLGDASALQNAGFSKLGQIGRVAVQNEITNVMKEQGLTNEDIMQRQTRFPAVKKAVDKLYGAQASMGQAGLEFKNLFPQFMADLQKYGATQYPDANKFFQFIDSHRGDPNVAPLAQRMITLSNVYGRAVSQNPQSANTDYKHREFAQALNQYWPLAATQRIGDAMNQEIQTAHDSVGKEVNRMFVDNGLGRKPDAATLNDAKAALARGNSRADILQRLSEHGFTGDGL